MKFLFPFLLLLAATTAFASDLLKEFNRRETIRISQEEGNALNFMKALGYEVAKVEEIEILNDTGSFITRDRDDILCVGNPVNSMLRCKNKAGISTVLYEGDAD